MLRKLLKHEFRATGRIMLPLYLILLVTSVAANISTRFLNHTNYTILRILAGLIMVGFMVAIIGACVMALVLMIQRFKQNLLSDEGYLMFTLPVSVHKLVWSKIIVSSVWFLATGVAVMLSAVISTFRVDFVSQFIEMIHELFQQITTYYALNGTAFLLESLLLLFLACAATCLLFYAAMSLGHSFANHKVLLSVAFFFAFQFVTEFVGLFGISVCSFDFDWLPSLNSMTATHIFMLISALCELVYCAVFYFITTLSLKKRLNLE